MEYFLYGTALLLAGGLFSLLLPERMKSACIAIAACVSSVLILIPAAGVLLSGNTLTVSLALANPVGKVELAIDRLSAFFIAVISVMSSIGTIYAAGYMKRYNSQNRTVASHFFFLSVLIISMLLVVVVRNGLAFLIVWEIMSLSSFFLVMFENEKEDVYRAGINYLVAMHIGVIFLISGFTVLAIYSGDLSFSSFRAVFEKEKELVNILFLLFFIGFGTKAGFVPFHTWLPKAHPAAPSHISGIMSGVMIKTGIYGILRIITLCEPTPFMAYFVLIMSLISGLTGVAYAISQHNLKKLLAYHSVENIGIIGIGIGLGLLGMVYKIPMLAVLGFSGGILHILNHSVFKSLLFYSAGGVYQAVHTLEIEKLGGLIKTMKWTAVFFMTGSIAISGLPPFNGFISEFFIYWGMIAGLQSASVPVAVALIVSIAGLSLIGAMALLCFTKAFGVVFLGSARSEYAATPEEVSWHMKTAMIMLCLFILVIGLAPVYVFNTVYGVAADMTGASDAVNTGGITATLASLTAGLFGFIAIFIIVFVSRSLLLRKKAALYKTWDCGYQAGNSRMQYTASSYADPFLKLARPVVGLKRILSPPAGLFPVSAGYESHPEDRFESKLIDPAVKIINRFLNLFSWIQSGNTQWYILYGLVFLIVISLWMMVA